MRNLILFDDETRDHLLPLTFLRPASLLRCGILTVREKWERYLDGKASFITSEYLTARYPIAIHDENLVISGTALPNARLVKLIGDLKPNEALIAGGDLIAANIPGAEFDSIIDGTFAHEIAGYKLTETPVLQLRRLWDLLRYSRDEIQCDFDLITRNRTSEKLHESNTVIGDPGELFCEPGATVYGATINCQGGPVYIGKNVSILEGCLIRGPVAICEGAVLKMGAKIYGPTTIGPFSKVGGEINHSTIMGYSNKAHDGYLGNSIIGEWCNLGAGTNISNLKNTYKDVRMWDYVERDYTDSGQLFLGVVIGDHTKCGISTMLNTGTVIGISANIFGTGYPQTFIPSFAWGGIQGWETFRLDKAIETAARVMARREIPFSSYDQDIFRHVFQHSAEWRIWDSK